MIVILEGRPDALLDFRGAEARGTTIVRQNPRMADVRIRDASRASFSRRDKRDRKSTKGWIIYEFHRKPASRLSIAMDGSSSVTRFCNLLVRSKSAL
jgi:hypothetical protein